MNINDYILLKILTCSIFFLVFLYQANCSPTHIVNTKLDVCDELQVVNNPGTYVRVPPIDNFVSTSNGATTFHTFQPNNSRSTSEKNSSKYPLTKHSAPIRNLIKLKGTVKLTVQGQQVCLKDSKYILFEIPARRTWKGCMYKLLLAEQAQFAGSADSSLYGPSMSYLLGFQAKYIWNPWDIPIHPLQLILQYLSTLLDSWLVHCKRQRHNV